MELTDHVYAFPLTYDLGDREMTIYPSGVETEDGLILLDVGLPGKIDTLADALAEDGFSLDDVDTLFLTHQDGDHVGGATELLDRTDASVVASVGDTPAIEGDAELVKSDRYPPINVDIEVVDGVTFRTEAGPMRVVETPGHTPGHLSVVLPEAELLIAADATVADEDGLQGPNETFTPEMETAISSLGKLAAFDTSGTLCYHGGFVEDADVEATYQSLTK